MRSSGLAFEQVGAALAEPDHRGREGVGRHQFARFVVVVEPEVAHGAARCLPSHRHRPEVEHLELAQQPSLLGRADELLAVDESLRLLVGWRHAAVVPARMPRAHAQVTSVI